MYRLLKYEHKFLFCKVEFTKLTFLAFFRSKICTCQKKVVSLHQI